jgi:hypothetical protein
MPLRERLLRTSGATTMKTPIILVKDRNLVVLTEFDGTFAGSSAETPHNMAGNRIRYVIDSNADLWSFEFVDSNHSGLRGIFSAIVRNISVDRYACSRESGISVGRFRDIVSPYQADEDPDRGEMAMALFESVATCDPDAPLREHIALLNL